MPSAIGLHGYEPGREDDPFWTVTGTPLDASAGLGPVGQQHREDLQVWSFLMGVGMSARGRHPIGVTDGNDPPDRYFDFDGHRVGVELTEFTIQDVRRELARVRYFGRRLEAALQADLARFEHLEGRSVVISYGRPENLRDDDAGLAQVLETLSDDLGCVGDRVDSSGPLPEVMPTDGFYGESAGVMVQVYRADHGASLPSVVATGSMKFHRSELIEGLRQRVIAKDKPGNDLVVLTCGLPDERGLTCPADSFLYYSAAELANTGQLNIELPVHTMAVALHHWPDGHWFEVVASGDIKPWK